MIGFTLFMTMLVLCTFGQKTAQIILLIAAAVWLVCIAVRPLRREPVLLCSVTACLAACVLFLTAWYTQFLPVRALDGQIVYVTAHLADLPTPDGDSVAYTLQTDTIDGEAMRCKMTLLCDDPPDAALTDAFSFSAKVYASDRPDSDGIWLRAFGAEDLQLSADRPTLRVRMLLIRRHVRESLMRALPGTPGAVLTAMLLGESQWIPADMYALMRRGGILHIFSISGFHLSVFAMTLLRALGRTRLPRPIYVPVCAGLVLFVMAVTGFPLSCVRAGLMLLLLLAGRLFAQRADALNSLGFALLLMGCIRPFSAGDVGLQLSVTGTLGVICLTPYAQRIADRIRIPWYPVRTAAQSALCVALISAGITVLTLPIAAVVFGSVSVVAPLTNACMLFAAEWAMTLAALASALSWCGCLSFLFHPLYLAAGLLARYCTAVASFFGKLSFAAPSVGDRSLVLWMTGTMLLAAAALLLRIPARRKVAAVTALSVLLLGISLSMRVWTTHNTVAITAPDVGNGTAVLVQSGGSSALIGCGGVRTETKIAERVSRLDAVFLPRMQTTEAGRSLRLLRTVPTRGVFVPADSWRTYPLYFFFDPHPVGGSAYRIGDASIEVFSHPQSAAIRIRAYDRTVLMLFSPGCDLSLLPQGWLDADALYARGDVPPALEAEKYGFVLLQGEQSHVSLVARQICARGGEAIGNGRLCIQKDGSIGIKAGD